MELPINQIICGDCIAVMKTWPDNCIDSIVTDPPAGISFMGKVWDTFDKSMLGKKGEEGTNDLKVKKNFEILPRYGNADLQGFQDFICRVFIEALRVLKPGGHALVWAIPRTSHHTAMGLERAGFEIRDCIYHVFGSGFPKSLDISKDLDRQKCREELEKKLGGKPTKEEFKKAWKDFRKVVGKRTDRAATLKCDIRGGRLVGGDRPQIDLSAITAPATSEAKQWQGWGTALKPAVECWWLCRKPLSEKTMAENVLKWGTGGLNIDGCRVAYESEQDKHFRSNEGYISKSEHFGVKGGFTNSVPEGRFPANLIHDGSDEVVGMFPNTQSGIVATNKDPYEGVSVSGFLRGHTNHDNQYGDSGSAARFFYTAKASKSERDAGLEGMEGKIPQRYGEMKGSENHRPNKQFSERNHHPTVKPIALMEYLIRLITPAGGTVLDMFAGSGSTLVAAKLGRWNYIGIEIEKEYIAIAEKRLKEASIELLAIETGVPVAEQKKGQKALWT